MWGAIAKGIGGAVVGEVAVNLALNTSGFKKDVKNTVKSTESSFGNAFGKITKMAAAAFSVKAIWDFSKASVSAASASQSAWTGLYSIVNGTGKSFADAKGFIEEYIKDGLVPLENATTAYKNLAARGYSTEQIEGTLTALKDAAAFGRQASYSLGDAITSATEGLKNENSILVDNAGVTKNVAKMWDEYAKSIGTTANNLTQAQKIQAEYNGIMQETKFQTGDAATYTQTFAGRTAQLGTAFLNLKTAVGKVIAPIASVFIPIITTAMNAVTRFLNKIQQLMAVFGFKWQDVVSKNASTISSVGDAATSTANNIGSIGDSASKTAKQLKRSLGSMDELNILNNNKDTSKGGSGGSGIGDAGSSIGGLGSMFDNVITEDPISPQIQKIAEKIREYIKPLKDINFDNLIKGLGKLKKSLEPITKKLGEGLEWLWFEVLVPYTTWAVEDLLPAWLNALSGALDFLNGALDWAMPYLQWFWDKFLQPIAKWTGGIVVGTLNNIGDALSKVGKFLSEIAPTYDEVTGKLSFEKLGKKFSDFFEQLPSKLGTWLGNATGKVVKFFVVDIPSAVNKFINETIPKKWNELQKKVYDFAVWLSKFDWKQYVTDLMNGLWKGIMNWCKDLNAKWEEYKTAFVKAFKKAFGINSPSKVFIELGGYLVDGLIEGVKEIWSNSWVKKYMYDPIVGWWQKKDPKLDVKAQNKTTSKDAANWWTNIKTWWGDKKLSVKNKLDTTQSTVTGWWNNVKAWWGDKTLSLKVKIGEVVGSVKSWFNNNLISPLNKKLPSFIPKIPYLAQGSWFAKNNPTLAVVGDNKREPEIVTPESKIYDQTYKAVKDAGGAGKQQLEITIYHKYEDGKTIIQKVNQAQIDAGEVLLLT